MCRISKELGIVEMIGDSIAYVGISMAIMSSSGRLKFWVPVCPSSEFRHNT
jgi:hypothetical protein